MFVNPAPVPLKYQLLAGVVIALVALRVGASVGPAWGRSVRLFLLGGLALGTVFRRPGAPAWQTALKGLAFGALCVTVLWMADGAPWE